jgi:hypothetical protein
MDNPSNWSRINKRDNGRGNGWSDEETTRLVKLYLHMLDLQKAGKLGRTTKANPDHVSKATLVKAFMADSGRTKGSVETKLMNISASMVALGLPTVTGYKALSNRSKGLDDVVRATIQGLNQTLGA